MVSSEPSRFLGIPAVALCQAAFSTESPLAAGLNVLRHPRLRISGAEPDLVGSAMYALSGNPMTLLRGWFPPPRLDEVTRSHP